MPSAGFAAFAKLILKAPNASHWAPWRIDPCNISMFQHKTMPVSQRKSAAGCYRFSSVVEHLRSAGEILESMDRHEREEEGESDDTMVGNTGNPIRKEHGESCFSPSVT